VAGPSGPRAVPAPPKFADAYTAAGYVLLPYANLTEPFTASFDVSQKKSRIDYYNGTMKTFQINAPYTNAPKGGAFKIVWSPHPTTHVPEQICYQANATDAAPTVVQSVFPSLDGFKYVGSEDCGKGSSQPKLVIKGNCDKWVLEQPQLNRSNTYTFLAQKNGAAYIPARYSMMGYDSLFGSHYDEYEMIYSAYQPGAQNADVFDAVKEAPAHQCVPYPAGSGLTADHLFNPMVEFVQHSEKHVDEHFEHFKREHVKKYSDHKEEAIRKNYFRHNQRFINSMNRKNTQFKLKINHLADLHRDERKYLRGRKYVPGHNGGLPFPAHEFRDNTPLSKDWRKMGIVSDVKDQAICGSCWSFGTTGHIESQYALKYNKHVRFSEQQLVDCSWNYGNGACDGGLDFQAYRYIMEHGLGTDEQYGPYMGIDGKCHDDKVTLPTLAGYVNVTGIEHLKKAVAYIGPISVGIDAAHESFVFYSHGVFSDPDCKNGPQDLDHAVLAVGYGVTGDGTWYWIVKNSWSTHWGHEGYVHMAMKDNMCGVATAATYVILP